MQLLPKNKFTWILIIILLYGYVSYDFTGKSGYQVKKPSNDDYGVKVSTSSGREQSAFQMPMQHIVDKLKENPTGKAVLDTIVNETIKKKYGDEELIVVSANHVGQTRTIDLKKGLGKESHCGSKVTVHYDAFFQNNVKFFSTISENKPISFTLGKGEVIKGLEQGVAGMAVGGKRKIAVPSSLAYDDPNFKNSYVPKGKPVIFEVQLIETIDSPNPPFKQNFYIEDIVEEGKKLSPKEVMCGSKVTIEYVAKKMDGKFIQQDPTNATFVIGEGSVMTGLSHGLIGARQGARRNIIIPTTHMKVPGKSIFPAGLFEGLEESFIIEVRVIRTS